MSEHTIRKVEVFKLRHQNNYIVIDLEDTHLPVEYEGFARYLFSCTLVFDAPYNNKSLIRHALNVHGGKAVISDELLLTELPNIIDDDYRQHLTKIKQPNKERANDA